MSTSDPIRDIRSRRRGDRGQATPLWVVLLVLAGLLLIPTGHLVRAGLDRSQARTAADAAAMAGAWKGEAEARAVAADNGAELTAYRRFGPIVEVTAVVGTRQATARARRDETIVAGPGARTPLATPRP